MERNIITPCPICGSLGNIQTRIMEGLYGFLDYEPPEKYAVFECPECGTRVRSDFTRDLDSPDSDLIREVQDKINIEYSQEIIERVGKFILLHLGKDLEWSEIVSRLRSPQNLIFE